MARRSLLALGAVLMAASNVLAEDYSMCRDDKCGDCPVTLASLGTGYPECIIYNTEDVFGGQDFPESDVKYDKDPALLSLRPFVYTDGLTKDFLA